MNEEIRKFAETLMNAIYSNNEEQKKKIENTRNAFTEVTAFVLENMKDSREKSLALTKLEEACMWTIKGITMEE